MSENAKNHPLDSVKTHLSIGKITIFGGHAGRHPERDACGQGSYFSAPNTFLMMSLPALTGSWRIFFSSSATMKNRPSSAFCVT